MEQLLQHDIKCFKCFETIVGIAKLLEGENYKGDDAYKMICDFCINDTSRYTSLEDLKIEKNNLIDSKTQEIITRGFIFDGHLFSLTDNAQRNWIGIAAGIAIGLYTEANFPFPMSDLSDNKYDLQWIDRFNFLGQVSYIIGLNKTIGTGLKQASKDATTQAELDLVIDNRQ